MKKIPVSIGNFREVITDNYVYVDKTRVMYDILQKNRRLFLSRPRRFGKSLLCSMLGELFAGNVALFKDTWIGRESGYAFKKHPVLSFSFSRLETSSAQTVKKGLMSALVFIGEDYGIDLPAGIEPQDGLVALVRILSKQAPVAIIVDEYDAPILSCIDDPQKAKAVRDILAGFFNAIKSLDDEGLVHAIFITGVTQFTKTSIFSAMNKLQILSMHEDAADLLGYTREEIELFFADHVAVAAQHVNESQEEFLHDLQEHYNGYRFSTENVRVYNPFSVNNCLSDNLKPRKIKFENYWAQSGTPTFLIALLEKRPESIASIEGVKISKDELQSFSVENIDFPVLLFQAGYLTIKEYDEERCLYELAFPNQEVSFTFSRYLVAFLLHKKTGDVDTVANRCKDALNDNNMQEFALILKEMFAGIPFSLQKKPSEADYHRLLHLFMYLIGLKPHSEVMTNKGFIDMVIETTRRITVFELKFNKTAKEALKQIKEMRYHERYSASKKSITLVGLSFNLDDKDLAIEVVQEDCRY